MSKTITIGSWDGEQQELQVEDNATVGDVLRKANIAVTPRQSITTFSNVDNVGIDSGVVDGETYLITSNQTSG